MKFVHVSESCGDGDMPDNNAQTRVVAVGENLAGKILGRRRCGFRRLGWDLGARVHRRGG